MKMYHGIELKEVTELQVFDPPKEMLVWDSNVDSLCKRDVCAIASKELDYPVLTTGGNFRHCAPIPEPESKPVTNRELSRWLAEGKGEVMDQDGLFTSWFYWKGKEDTPVKDSLYVRKWSETGWHAPTRESLGLEDK